VESDYFVTKNVLAGSERLGNCDRPLAVSSNQLVSSPLARSRATIDQTSFIDLKPLKGLLVNGGAVTTSALSEVVDDGTMVRLGPGVSAPLDFNLAASGHRGRDLAILGLAVADDVTWGVAGTVNEAVVSVLGAPGDDSRRFRHVEVIIEEAVVWLAISGDTSNAAVGVGRSGERAQKGGSLEEGHCIVVLLIKCSVSQVKLNGKVVGGSCWRCECLRKGCITRILLTSDYGTGPRMGKLWRWMEEKQSLYRRRPVLL
jgi:hypothetical protein